MNNQKVVQQLIFPERINIKAERFYKKNINENFDNDEFQIGMPNVIIRSAIFSGEKRKNTEYLNNENLVSYHKNINIEYTGPKLDKKDQQVFYLCLLALKMNKLNFGEFFRIFPANWLSILGRTDNTNSRNELANSLKRLSSASISIIKKKNSNGTNVLEEMTGSLLSGFNRKSLIIEDENIISSDRKIDIKWLVMVNPFFKDLYFNDLTLLDLNVSKKIKSTLGLWLYDFYSSHNDPIPLSTSKIKKLSGVTSTLSHFHQYLKKSLEELMLVGFLEGYSIENKTKEEKVLLVSKKYRSPIINIKKPISTKKKSSFYNSNIVL